MVHLPEREELLLELPQSFDVERRERAELRRVP